MYSIWALPFTALQGRSAGVQSAVLDACDSQCLRAVECLQVLAAPSSIVVLSFARVAIAVLSPCPWPPRGIRSCFPALFALLRVALRVARGRGSHKQSRDPLIRRWIRPAGRCQHHRARQLLPPRSVSSRSFVSSFLFPLVLPSPFAFPHRLSPSLSSSPIIRTDKSPYRLRRAPPWCRLDAVPRPPARPAADSAVRLPLLSPTLVVIPPGPRIRESANIVLSSCQLCNLNSPPPRPPLSHYHGYIVAGPARRGVTLR